MRKLLVVLASLLLSVFVIAKFSSGVLSNSLFVAITNPTNGSVVSGTVAVSAEATASAGVTNVNFYIDGGLAASDSAAPYGFVWDTNGLVPGSFHYLMASVLDQVGEATNSATVSVQMAPDTTAPSVAITNPVNGSGVKRNSVVAISASASDNYQVNRVEFYVNGILLCSDSSNPYGCNWTVPNGKKQAYAILARAFDPFGNNSSSSVVVTSQ